MNLIAEIGCNHQGSMETARKMIEVAAPHVWACKFQKRDDKKFNAMTWEHPNPEHAFAENYGEHRRKLEFGYEQHKELQLQCQDHNVQYSSSVWDLRSALDITCLDPIYIKIPSARNTDFELAEFIRDRYDHFIHVSLGMTTEAEFQDICNFWWRDRERVVLYLCTSDYPTQPQDMRLRLIERIKDEGFPVGLSGHYEGHIYDAMAVALGVEYLERHFTLDRTMKGTDHAFSLDPKSLSLTSETILDAQRAMTGSRSFGLVGREAEYREKLGKRSVS